MSKTIKIEDDTKDVFLTIINEKLNIDATFYDDDEKKIEGGSVVFTMPLEPLRKFLKSN